MFGLADGKENKRQTGEKSRRLPFVGANWSESASQLIVGHLFLFSCRLGGFSLSLSPSLSYSFNQFGSISCVEASSGRKALQLNGARKFELIAFHRETFPIFVIISPWKRWLSNSSGEGTTEGRLTAVQTNSIQFRLIDLENRVFALIFSPST